MMKLTVDEEAGVVTIHDEAGERIHALDSSEAFEAVSKAWLRTGWDVKHVYSFTWLGRPIIQLPEDMVRIQEVIWSTKPDVIVETGVAHGGSLIFYASLFEAMGHGRVIGVDVEIRPHNRRALEEHPLFRRIDLIEGDSKSGATLEAISRRVQPDETVMVILDSNHRHDHVLAELHAYAPLVTTGSWLVATDGIMAEVVGRDRTAPDWAVDNPITAMDAFLLENSYFRREEPGFLFNEGRVAKPVTYWPKAFLRRFR
jgi:cephalosporin hydroxylase